MSLSFEPYVEEYRNLRFLLNNFKDTMEIVKGVEESVKLRIEHITEQAEKMGLDISCDQGRNMASRVRETIGVWLDCSYKYELKAYTCRTDWWTLKRKVSDLSLYWPVSTGTFKGLTLKCAVERTHSDGWRLKDYVTKAFANGYSIHTFTEEDMGSLLEIKALITEIEALTHEEGKKK